MKTNLIRKHFEEANEVLNEFLANEKNFSSIANAGELLVNSIQNGGKILSCGNGGSMCDAMHFAEEMTGRFRENRKPLPAFAISDSSHISCTSNDYGYEYIFSRYVEAFGKPEDVLLAISTSGNSQNVLLAAKEAKKKGMKVIGLTGKDGGLLQEVVDAEVRAPKTNWADRVQEIHIKVIHSLIDYVEQNINI